MPFLEMGKKKGGKMNPKKGQKRKMNRRKKERWHKNNWNGLIKKRSPKRRGFLDLFTPEGIPVSSPLNLGISFTTIDAF